MMLSRVEEELHVPTLPEFTPGFSEVRIAQYVVFCIEVSEHYLLFCIFHVGHCVASPHSTYSLWLILWEVFSFNGNGSNLLAVNTGDVNIVNLFSLQFIHFVIHCSGCNVYENNVARVKISNNL
jgi:hypothetical protein